MRDLGLSYDAAAHGIQSAIRFEMTKLGIPDDDGHPIARFLKHIRVGLDCRAAEEGGLVELLFKKGIITEAEYGEAMRLAVNEELARYEQHIRETYDLPDGASFR